MITFKSTSDLSKLSPDDPAFPTVKPYDHEAYGYVILLNSAPEVNGTLDELWDGSQTLRFTNIDCAAHPHIRIVQPQPLMYKGLSRYARCE